MNLLKSRIGFALALVAGMLVCGVATATPITMNFDGLSAGTSVDGYYNGGCSHWLFLDVDTGVPADCHGPNDGVVWDNAHTRAALDAPSPPNWAGPGVFSNGVITMNVASGFDTGLYFYYTTFLKVFTGNIAVYSDVDGHGSVLGRLDLSGTGIYCNGDIPCWFQTGLDFTGLAKSVVFTGPGSAAFGLDNVTIGAGLPVPEPAAFDIFGLGLLLLGAFVGLRRRLTERRIMRASGSSAR